MMSAQTLKTLIFMIQERKLNIKYLCSAGGMPSSHSAMVTALAISTGLQVGFDNQLFAVCVIFAFIVIYDSFGIRKSVGIQAKVLNEVLPEIKKHDTITLSEMQGHTLFQVIMGILWGGIIASLFFIW